MSMHPPPDPDELASDLVDGLLSADEAARLRTDPAIATRVEAIEAARAALRVPPPSAPGAVDRALAATFAALDRGAPPGDQAVAPEKRPPPPVTHLRSVDAPTAAGGGGPWAPTQPAKRGSSGMPWLAAAAAIVLLGLVTIGILSNGSDSDGDQATSAASDSSETEADDGGGEGAVQSGDDETTAVEERADDGTAAGGSDPAASPPTTAEPLDPSSGTGGVRQLGAVASAAELADRIRSQDGLGERDAPEQEANPSDGVNETSACPARTVAGDPSRGESLYVADAVLDGARVRVHVYDPGDGNRRLVATDESCVDVVDAPYSD